MSTAGAEALARRIIAAPAAERRALLARTRRHPGVVAALKARVDLVLRSDAREALRLARLAHAAGRASGDGRARATGEHALAKAHHAAQRYAEAVDLYARAASSYASLGLARDEASVLLGSVGALFHLGRFAEAEAAARRARPLFLAAGDALGAAKLHVNLANVRHGQDRHLAAVSLLEEARPVLLAAGDLASVAGIDLNRANSYALLARFERSSALYAAARAAYARLGQVELVARTDYNLAYDHFLQGRVHEARRLLGAAREIFRRSGMRHSLALASRDEAEMALLVNQPERALEAADEARRVFAELGAPVEAARADLHAAEAARGLGREDEAVVHLSRARDAFAAAGHAPGRAAADLGLAAASARPAALRLAAALDAAKVFARHGLAAREAAALVVAGTVELERRRGGAARRLLGQALHRARRRGLVEVELRAEHALGRAEEDSGRNRAALVRYRRSLGAYERLRAGMRSDEDRLAFAADKRVVFEDGLRVALDLGRDEEAFELVERSRSRALADLLASHPRFSAAATSTGGVLARRLGRLKRAAVRHEARVSDRQRRAEAVPAAWAEALRLAVNAREQAEESLVAGDPEVSYALAGRPVARLEDVRAVLGPERTLLATFGESGQLGALLVSKGELRVFRGLASTASVARALSSARFALNARRLAQARSRREREDLAGAAAAALGELRRLLLAPVEAHLDDRALVVVPHGPLHLVPFHALLRSGQPLLAEREVSMAPSATVLLRASARRPATTAALVMAVPDASLPQAEREARAVVAAFGGRLLEGAAATSAALRREARRYRIIHFATHGIYEPADALLSGLDLADGRLTVPEVAALKLDAALVTLSACESGVGTPLGDEFVGLVRAFLHAGTRTVVASLWAMPDASAAAFMELFYGHLRRGGTAAAGLRAAALELRRTAPHPCHWAAFQVVGSWGGVK